MNANINLLIHKNEESLKQKKKLRLINLIAVLFLLSIGIISLFVFITTKLIDASFDRKKEQEVLQNLAKMQDRQNKLFVVNNRIEAIDKILKTKKNLPDTMSVLLAKVPSELVISDFSLDSKSVVVSGQSKSLFSIGEFINKLTEMVRKKEIINSLKLNSLSLDESSNNYSVSIGGEL